MICEMLEYCPFYSDLMPMEKGVGAIYKKKYCLGNKEECARYRVITELGVEYVSESLYPNMHDLAGKILDKAKKHQNDVKGAL